MNLEELSKMMFKKSFSIQVVQRQNNNKKKVGCGHVHLLPQCYGARDRKIAGAAGCQSGSRFSERACLRAE